MDRQSVYSLSVLPPDYENNDDTRGQVQAQLEQFILQFRLDNAFVYRYALYHSRRGNELTTGQRPDP
jgi:hypothetical protein